MWNYTHIQFTENHKCFETLVDIHNFLVFHDEISRVALA